MEESLTLSHLVLTHEELLMVTKSTLNELRKNDPVQQNLPEDITLEEVEALTAVSYGQAVTVNVLRGTDEISVIVKRETATVSDLKRALQRALNLKLRREGKDCKISWKHIWRVYWLCCGNCNFKRDSSLLQDYGVVHKSHITFVPKMEGKMRKRRMAK